MIQRATPKNGYTLIEAIIYVTILSVFFVIIINSMLSFATPYKKILALRLVERSGLDSMERITRDIRSATTVDTANSTLGSSPGVLTLVSTSGGVSTTTKFYVQNNILKVDVNGVYQGPLSSSSSTVNSLIFNTITNSISTAVKVDLIIQATVGTTTEIKSYHSTIILKGA